ncbi:MAG: GTP cyclohydrolase I FolE [Parvularculaceae bacterium]|nr:GTP cyclohydrolase I FolE [Parvularculaceae bacterium]
MSHRPDKDTAEAAVRTLLSYLGENPDREGLVDTPMRVIKAYDEWFKGYEQNPDDLLGRTFDDVGGYDDMVIMKDIRFESHCEHHIAPMLGTAHVAYLPAERVVGISKLARVVEAYSKRLQSQETMTEQIAQCINRVLKPRGVAVIMSGTHECISTRGIHKPEIACVTRTLLGEFKTDRELFRDFMDLVR